MDGVFIKVKTVFSPQYVLLMLLGLVLAYLLRANVSYELQPVWRKRVEERNFLNGNFPTVEDRLPPPIITDLESDGINEIVLITNDLKLNVLALPEHSRQEVEDKSLPHVKVKSRVDLPVKHGTKISRPVVMTTGYTMPYLSMIQVRKQIIVIVTDDWVVLCYSPDLTLLWKQKLLEAERLQQSYSIKAMGALITAHSVKKGDEGLVIIGGSFTHDTHTKPQTSQNNAEENMLNDTAENKPDPTAKDEDISHFSTFALSGNNGTMRWHHLPGDFGEKSSNTKDTETEHHWKLGLRRHRLHVGEASWELYKEELFKHMPHLWQNIGDTKITLGKFHKNKDINQDQNEETSTISALKTEHIIGYAYGGQRPHSHHEHIQNPNVVIIKKHNGIEVLNILTGRPVTRYPLEDDSSVYVDIDMDGIVERLTWGQGEGQSPCYVDIWKFYPVKENVEKLSVCKSKRLVFTSSWVYNEDSQKKLPPVVIKSIAKKGGMLRHLLGHHLSEPKSYDIITLGGYGRLTSQDTEGSINWQVVISATWVDVSTTVKKESNVESDLYKEFHHSFYPNRQMSSLEVYGERNVLAVVGWQSVALVDLKEGKILAEHSIPAPPTSRLVIGDFDNDGLNDLILTSKKGYIGFTVKKQWNHMYTAMYVTAVALLIFLTAHFLKPDEHED